MDHIEAEKNQAVERYILNEMDDGERDGFEEHYFDCRTCAADVVEGERLMASGRAVMRETPAVLPFAPRRSWKAWTPAAAAAMLLAANVAIVVPRLPGPAIASGPKSEIVQAPQPIRIGMNRNASAPLVVLRAGVTNALNVEILPNPLFKQYELRLLDRAGKPVVPTEKVQESEEGVHWLLSSLPAGSYVLAVHGVKEDGNRPVIATHEVTVQ